MKNYEEIEVKNMRDAANGASGFFVVIVICIAMWYLW